MSQLTTGVYHRIGTKFWSAAWQRCTILPPRLVMLMSFSCMSIVNYAFGLTAGWLLVPGDFGLLAFAQTILTIAGLILNSGFAWPLTAALIRSNGSQRASLVRGAVTANLLLALAISVAIILLFAWGPLKPGLETWTVTGLVVMTLPLLSFIAIARATVQGFERFGVLALFWVCEVVSKAVAGVALVLAGFGVMGAVGGFLIGALIAATLAMWVLMRMFDMRPWGAIRRPSMGVASGMFGALLGMGLLLNLDIVALKLFSDGARAMVGYYQASIVLANTPYYLATAMIPILFTQIARLKGVAQTSAAVGEACGLALILLMPIEGVLVAAPETVLGMLFPHSYMAGASALRILALGNSALILVAILSAAFQAVGKAHIPARILVAIVTCEAIMLWKIVPIWHAQGASSMFLAATASALLVLGTSYISTLGLKAAQHAGLWLMKYAIALAIGILVGIIVLGAGGNILLAMGLGGPCYLATALRLGLLHLASLTSRKATLQQVPLATGE